MSEGGRKVGDALEGFLSEHGRCWRISGEDLALVEDRTVLWLTCPGCEAAVALRDVPRGSVQPFREEWR